MQCSCPPVGLTHCSSLVPVTIRLAMAPVNPRKSAVLDQHNPSTHRAPCPPPLPRAPNSRSAVRATRAVGWSRAPPRNSPKLCVPQTAPLGAPSARAVHAGAGRGQTADERWRNRSGGSICHVRVGWWRVASFVTSG